MAVAVQPLSRGRKVLVWVLVVVATLLLLVSSLTIWVKRQMLDNTAWNKATVQVINDPQVQSALSVYLVNQLYDNVDVAAALRQRLPPNLDRLAAPAAAALRQPAANGIVFLLGRPRVQKLFIGASARTHQKLVNVLENKTGYGISTGNGVVTLNVHGLLTQLSSELGLPGVVASKVPPDAGNIVLMRSSQLGAAQSGVQAIRVLSVWLLVAVLGLYALAVGLARGSRRIVLRRIAWGFILVGILLLVVRKLVGNYVVNAIASPTYKGTGHHVWLIFTSIMGQIGVASLLYGIVALAGVVLAGPTRPARAVRAWIAPVLNTRQEFAWGAVGFVFLLLVLWGPTHALRTWWGILLIGALIVAGVVALRRQTLREAEEGALPSPLEQLHALVARSRGDGPAVAAAPAGPAAPAAPTPATAMAEQLAHLRELHDAHLLTDAEYERARSRVPA